MTPLRIVFFGSSDFGIPALAAMRSKHSLVAVVSTPDKPAGRRLQLEASPAKQWALAQDVSCFDYLHKDPSVLISRLRDLRPDLFIVISFGAILKNDLLMIPRLYSLNVHASLLPKYRGASPIQYALLNGDPETGVSVMRMIERLDAGDVLIQKKLSIGAEEDVTQLKGRLSLLGAEALMAGLDEIERDQARFRVQNETQASYAKKISKEDGRVHWSLPAAELHGRIRAFSGWPGSFFFFKGKRIMVGKARVASQPCSSFPGTVLDALSVDGLKVASGGSTVLCLQQLQMEGKKMLEYKEFVKGFALKAGDVLE